MVECLCKVIKVRRFVVCNTVVDVIEHTCNRACRHHILSIVQCCHSQQIFVLAGWVIRTYTSFVYLTVLGKTGEKVLESFFIKLNDRLSREYSWTSRQNVQVVFEFRHY